MSKTMKLAIAFMALAGAASTIAYAQGGRDGGMRGGGMRFDRLDADSSGDVTFEEFAAAMHGRFGEADTDKDGKMTVAEIAAQLERIRNEHRAQRMIDRFDADGDGALSTVELQEGQKKRFAVLDRNNDGKIVKDEMPRRGHRN